MVTSAINADLGGSELINEGLHDLPQAADQPSHLNTEELIHAASVISGQC